LVGSITLYLVDAVKLRNRFSRELARVLAAALALPWAFLYFDLVVPTAFAVLRTLVAL
jgi:hypothetical protein